MITIDDLKNMRRQKMRVESLQERIERLRSRAEYTQVSAGAAIRREIGWRSMSRSWMNWSDSSPAR